MSANRRNSPRAGGEDGARPRALCIAPILTAPRIAKRVAMLRQSGFDVRLAGFERPQRLGRPPDCPVRSLGPMPDGHYATRLLRIARAAPKMRAEMRGCDLAYAFNSDSALLALLAGAGLRRPLVMETSDLMPPQTDVGLRGRAARALDRRIARSCKLLTLTSYGYETHFRDRLRVSTPRLVIENKAEAWFADAVLERDAPPSASAPFAGRPLRVGWFGALRDEWSLRVLDALTRAAPERFSAALAGTPIGLPNFEERVAANPNMAYHGPYDHPDGLPALYDAVDLTMACRAPETPDGLSQTNRYYDACLFRKPLIVRAGSVDGENARRLGIGLPLTASDPEEAAAEIRSVPDADWERRRSAMASLPREVYVSAGDAEALRDALLRILNA